MKFFWGPLFFTGRGFVIYVGYCCFSGGFFAIILLADYIFVVNAFCGVCVLACCILWFMRFGRRHLWRFDISARRRFSVFTLWAAAYLAFCALAHLHFWFLPRSPFGHHGFSFWCEESREVGEVFLGALFFTGRGFVIFVGYCFFVGEFLLLYCWLIIFFVVNAFCGVCVLACCILWFMRFGRRHLWRFGISARMRFSVFTLCAAAYLAFCALVHLHFWFFAQEPFRASWFFILV